MHRTMLFRNADFGLEIGSRLVNEGVCSAIVTKEDVASPAEIQKGVRSFALISDACNPQCDLVWR